MNTRNAKLKLINVRAIRRHKGKTTALELAEKYGVNRTTIYHIWSGFTWADDMGNEKADN